MFGVWSDRSPKSESGRVVGLCDVYGALCGMAEKRGALEGCGDWRHGTNRVVVVVKGPGWTGDVGRGVSSALPFFLLWESGRKTG